MRRKAAVGINARFFCKEFFTLIFAIVMCACSQLENPSDAGAQFELGKKYYLGDGAPKDEVKAADWFEKAAAQGDIRAQAYLGLIYDIGDLRPQDYVLAYAWLTLAALHGNETVKQLYDGFPEARGLSYEQLSEAKRLASGWKMGQVLHR